MKHFIGGWALMMIVGTAYSLNLRYEGKSVGLGMAASLGWVVGILGGLAAWGLLP